LLPADQKSKCPLLWWQGGGLTGVTWETKPDGKPGFMQSFLRAGHPTYVSDAVERGRASWSRDPKIFASEPFFRNKKEAWELFRIGPQDSYNVDKHGPWKRLTPSSQAFARDLQSRGGKVDRFDLPKMGITGNTRMSMRDENSDPVARLIQEWMAKNGLMKWDFICSNPSERNGGPKIKEIIKFGIKGRVKNGPAFLQLVASPML